MSTFPTVTLPNWGPGLKAYIDDKVTKGALTFNLLDYGTGVGTGSDDTAAFTAADAAAVATGSTAAEVFVPPGTYKVSNYTVSDGVSVRGAGPKASKITATATGACLSVGVNTVISGLYVTGTTIAGGVGVQSRTNSLHSVIRECSITGHAIGVKLEDSYIISIRDTAIQSCTTGLNLTGSTGCNIILVSGGETQGCTNGVIIDGTNNYGLKFIGHTSEGNSNKGYAVNGTTYGLTIRDGYMEANTNGHIVFAGTGHYGPTVDACHFAGAATFGVSVGDGVTVKDIKVCDHTFNLSTVGAKPIDLGTAVTFAYVDRNHYVSGSVGTFVPSSNFRGNRLVREENGVLTVGTSVASAALGGAPLNIPHGTAPTSPNNGDIWTTTAGLFVRINGTTVGPLS
jgi:hypothetical protein